MARRKKTDDVKKIVEQPLSNLVYRKGYDCNDMGSHQNLEITCKDGDWFLQSEYPYLMSNFFMNKEQWEVFVPNHEDFKLIKSALLEQLPNLGETPYIMERYKITMFDGNVVELLVNRDTDTAHFVSNTPNKRFRFIGSDFQRLCYFHWLGIRFSSLNNTPRVNEILRVGGVARSGVYGVLSDDKPTTPVIPINQPYWISSDF